MKKKKRNDRKKKQEEYLTPDYYDQYDEEELEKKFRPFFTIVFGVYLSMLLILSLLPGASINNELISTNGLILHYIGYMFLLPITLLFFAVFDIKGFTRKSVFFCMMIGGLTELAQYFIPGRACSLLDFSVNILGVFTIPIIILLVIEKMKEDEQPNEYEL